MKAVILAGGRGTRISEESLLRPKPMIEIGGRPILWHIMKMYSAHGIHEFIICCGYKGYAIKEYFANYFLHSCDISVDIANHNLEILRNNAEPWVVTVVDTGLETMTGGRLKRVQQYLGSQDFAFTYGDGVADVDLTKLVAFHRAQGKLATVTAVSPPARFGALVAEGNEVIDFREKPAGDGWINGGFFVLSPGVLDLISGDDTTWERGPMETLARKRQLACYRHDGFWQAMDTLRDKEHLERLWTQSRAPWKIW
ncbi:MAG TPA: glucose-1-phosphate cytidylyltransferase [Terriglobales bacterium]|nr:glucose-1-phosphate cytidylyltransferase [Terriglobales bacterium]